MKHRSAIDRKITSKWSNQTQLVRAGSMRSNFDEMGEALFLTSAFAYETAEEAEARFDGRSEGFTYSRQTNPTVSMFEERMALIEGADIGRATATGMAAMTAALLCQLKAGDHVLGARALFGSCRWLMDELLPRYGIETTVIDGTDIDAWKNGVQSNTKVLFLETPANPTLEIVDLKAVADIAHENGAKLVVDNVFATPILQKPMDFGADIVCYSTTKHIDGQGRCLGGMILTDHAFDEEFLYPFYRHTGCAMSPFNAWIMLKGLETLGLRVNAMCDNAEQIAANISDKLDDVRHPSLTTFRDRDLAAQQMTRGGTMIAFELPGGRDQAFKFMNSLEIVDISNNLGEARSIATHPWSTTHKALQEDARLELGITPGLIRFSCGLEDGDDLVNDVMQALEKAGL
ncbi:O-succinylhomoserine sulfhydrylase [Kordiimonas sp. SCSIO 12610]|uniref:O-succinylhomoserine sulfhydrylase n=1 Tax=Kordiimonas sp. SCSIO 12610 TaxID=2829597 RepID=UPI00210AEA41|nr:O-succinylhomoserine sulfhydrylase [Kordiimonas sp. SCSIO 12610]UTW55500.1 O-succinylhomoserine sulfhydrylase [Kordiimonas sp. SCSIO 12610]